MINHGSGPVVKSEEDSSAAPDAEQVDPMMISKLYKCQSVKLFLLEKTFSEWGMFFLETFMPQNI